MYYTKFDELNIFTGVMNTAPEDMTDIYEIEDELASKRLRLDNGVVREETEEEFASYMESLALQSLTKEVRFQRDLKLEESDKFMFADRWASFSSSQQTAISNYRQLLRDVPSQEGFPEEVVWPELVL